MRGPAAEKGYVQAYLDLYHAAARKKYGQNFLIDDQIAKEIVDALPASEKTIEIGPGLGALTYHLLQKGCPLTVVDLDPVMVEHLSLETNGEAIEIIHGDFLRYPLQKEKTPFSVIGNIPYYITAEMVEKLLKSQVSHLVLMVQKEAYERLKASKGSKEYGPLSIFCEYCGGSKLLRHVSRKAYFPEPHVDSVVFTMDVHKSRVAKDEKKFFEVTKRMFLLRRKTILNNLLQIVKEKEKAKQILADLKVDERMRPEQLPLSFYLDLADYLTNQSPLS